MKKPLREKLILLLDKINNRITILDKYIAEYKEAERWEEAMKASIKARTLELVKNDLEKILYK